MRFFFVWFALLAMALGLWTLVYAELDLLGLGWCVVLASLMAFTIARRA